MTRWVFNEDGWTDWQQHDGKGCPCVGWMVDVVYENGRSWYKGPVIATGNKKAWCWIKPHSNQIIRYRVSKPKGAEMLERLVQDVPEPVDA